MKMIVSLSVNEGMNKLASEKLFMGENMTRLKTNLKLVKALLSNLQLLRLKPSVNWFLAKYISKFTLSDVGGQLIIHSHLPAINSKAFTRFINEQLLVHADGPSHAQIALTNACPQKCEYCYNKNRTGQLMDTDMIKRTIRDLKEKGVVWFGFTGGEPLLRKDLVDIVDCAGRDSTVKLFTTGTNLTTEMAFDLKKAGLDSVSISLDHWVEQEHDRVRGCSGAYRTALQAIEILRKTGGIHIGVSSVISKDMIASGQVESFIQFLQGIGVHEAWLSEVKPTVEAFRDKEKIITEDERLSLVALQDRYNSKGEITINYLGHFEGREHFGCNAGNKMVYIDAFGEVSPCVFIPVTFGNVRNESIMNIFSEMKKYFPTEDSCFINKNYALLKKYDRGQTPLCKEDTLKMMEEVQFGSLAKISMLTSGKTDRTAKPRH